MAVTHFHGGFTLDGATGGTDTVTKRVKIAQILLVGIAGGPARVTVSGVVLFEGTVAANQTLEVDTGDGLQVDSVKYDEATSLANLQAGTLASNTGVQCVVMVN